MNNPPYTVGVAVSTTGSRPKRLRDLLNSLIQDNKDVDEVIVILQCSEAKIIHAVQNIIDQTVGSKGRLITMSIMGLSSSRNAGIRAAKSNILLLADDDLIYPAGIINMLRQEFSNAPNAAVLTFQVAVDTHLNKLYKVYRTSPRNHNYLSSFRVWSPEMAYNLDLIRKLEVKFDEDFGLGSKWATGEENIFLVDLIRRGLRVGYIPKILSIHDPVSSGDNLDRSQFFNKGAVFIRMFGVKGFAYCFLISVRKSRSIAMFIKNILFMISGAIDYYSSIRKKRKHSDHV